MPNFAFAVSDTVRAQSKRTGQLGMIALLHIGFFYMLQNGLLDQRAQPQPQAAPREVMASFITPPSPEKQKTPASATPKPKPAAKKPVIEKKRVERPAPAIRPAPANKPSKAIAEPPPQQPAPASAQLTSGQAAPAAPSTPMSSAAPVPQVTASATPKTISGVEYIQPPQPEYPPLSRRMREEGKVLLRILVNEKGRPARVDIQKPSGSARLDEAARQAAMRALFKPHLEDGRPVAVFALVPVNFSIQ